jgi:predicted TPR repeat methyltransferase
MIHNFKQGFINFCQICNSNKIQKVIDLGFQPLADDLLINKKKNSPSLSYPIKIYLCKSCRLLQNNFIVSDQTLYSKNYHYRPGVSKTVEQNLFDLSKHLIKLYNLKKDDLIVDVGCSDGTLLNCFKQQSFTNLLGVEPTNTFKFTLQKKIPVLNKFFNESAAAIALKKYGKAKLITTTNVFAHTGNLKDFILGIKKLIKNDGYFVVENHYLKEIIEQVQFDSFYHEHLRTYSLKSLIKLMNYYNFNIYDAYTTRRYNGNIQAHFTLRRSKMKKNVLKILSIEKKSGLDNLKTYNKFFVKIKKAKDDLFKYVSRNPNKKIIGKAFPARAAVILNYFSFLKDKIEYIAEQPSSLKLNHYISGTNIKIINSNLLKKMKPDIIIIFAWHLFHEIKNKWKNKGLSKKTKYVLMLPKLKIYK